MKGEVHAINAELGLVAIETPVGFTILEQTAPDFCVGDYVDWRSDEPRGTCEVRNASQGKITRAYFLHHRVPTTLLKANLQT